MGGGFWIQHMLMGWIAYEVTSSPFLTSLSLGLLHFPYLFAGPFGGLIADRLNKRAVLVTVFALKASLTAAYAIAVAQGLVHTWHIFAYAISMGILWALSDPVRLSIIPNVVPRAGLVNAFALNSLGFNTMRFIVPAISGVLIVWIGSGYALMTAAALYATAATALIFVRTTHADETKKRTSGFGFMEGINYARKDPLVKAVVLLGLMPSLLVGPFTHGLMPVFATEVFEVDARGLGLMLSAVGVGSLVGTVVLASIGDIRRKGRVLIVMMGISAAAVLVYSANPYFWLALPILAVLFGAAISFHAISNATVQTVVPDFLRGRVAAVSAMVFGVQPLGAIVSGGIAEKIGPPQAMVFSGVVMIIMLAFIAIRYPVLRRFGTP